MTINISSPNTQNLRALQSDAALDALLGAIQERRRELARLHGRNVPIFVKIAPDLDADQVALIAATLRRNAIDGVIATNTTIARERVAHLPHGDESRRPVGCAGVRGVEPRDRAAARRRSARAFRSSASAA